MADLLEGVKYDKNGIPILSEEQIEEIALSILFKFDNELIEKCTMVPLGKMVKSLGDKHGLKIISKKLSHGKLGYFDVKTVKEISENFQVSKQVARIRLQKFDFVKEGTAKTEDSVVNISNYLPKLTPVLTIIKTT
ncbi:MAG: hypothetical protein L3J71_10810 [Victivallaceae bacterium]|nr:hypothetical protein [Victivallaceae bacterium]